ncbi:unnamed protein product [Prunus brigantina]
MKELIGRPGSVSGLLLRIGQFSCASIAISVMVTTAGFATFTAFCYLIASMGLQLLWSLGLACLDIYALWKKRDLQNPILVSLFVVGNSYFITSCCKLLRWAYSYVFKRPTFLQGRIPSPMHQLQVCSCVRFCHLGSYCHIFSRDVLDLIGIGLETHVFLPYH